MECFQLKLHRRLYVRKIEKRYAFQYPVSLSAGGKTVTLPGDGLPVCPEAPFHQQQKGE